MVAISAWDLFLNSDWSSMSDSDCYQSGVVVRDVARGCEFPLRWCWNRAEGLYIPGVFGVSIGV